MVLILARQALAGLLVMIALALALALALAGQRSNAAAILLAAAVLASLIAPAPADLAGALAGVERINGGG